MSLLSSRTHRADLALLKPQNCHYFHGYGGLRSGCGNAGSGEVQESHTHRFFLESSNCRLNGRVGKIIISQERLFIAESLLSLMSIIRKPSTKGMMARSSRDNTQGGVEVVVVVGGFYT